MALEERIDAGSRGQLERAPDVHAERAVLNQSTISGCGSARVARSSQ